MLSSTHPFSGFTALSDKIYLFEPKTPRSSSATPDSTEPTTILIYGWGDANPRNVSKYAAGYQNLYPSSRIIVILCTLVEAMLQFTSRRAAHLQPVVNATMLGDTNDDSNRILVHIMSNSGASSFIATVIAWQEMEAKRGGERRAFPCTLMVCDSAPGNHHLRPDIWKWAPPRALASATAAWAPLPEAVMMWVWVAVLLLVEVVSLLLGIRGKQIGRRLKEGIRDPAMIGTAALRLYMYSTGDPLIPWDDIEEHIADVRGRGYRCVTERFEESGHVSHMRLDPARYWGAIQSAWKESIGNE